MQLAIAREPVVSRVLSVLLCGTALGCFGQEPTWRLDEVRVRATQAEHVSVIADCRGANRLAWRWESVGDSPLMEPAWMEVSCHVATARPTDFDVFDGPQHSLRPWRSAERCTPRLAEQQAMEDCSEVARMVQDEVAVTGPWCRLRFHFSEASTGTARITTYCRRD